MKRILIPTLILLVALAAVAAPPRPGAGPGAPGQDAGPQGQVLTPPQLAEFLDLSEAQVDQAKVIRDEMRAAVEPVRAQLRDLRNKIDAALDAGNALEAGTLMLQTRTLREQIEAARAAADAKFEALLTPAQKAKWDIYQEIVELRRERGPRE